MAPAPISTFDSSNDASSPGHKVSSNLGSIKIIDFGPKGGVFHARVRLDIQEIPRLKIYFDNAPTRTVMISAGENIVELRGNVPSKLIGTVKVSVQVFCDEEIVDSAPLGVFNMKDLMNGQYFFVSCLVSSFLIMSLCRGSDVALSSTWEAFKRA